MVGPDAAGLLPNAAAKLGVGVSSVSRRPRQARRRGPRYVLRGAPAVSECLWTNADDCLPVESLGRVEGGDGIVEGRDVADVGPQSSVPHPLDDLTQLGTIGLDDEVDCQAVGGPRLGRPYDGHQGSSGPDPACGPLPDAPADDLRPQVDAAEVFQGVVV